MKTRGRRAIYRYNALWMFIALGTESAHAQVNPNGVYAYMGPGDSFLVDSNADCTPDNLSPIANRIVQNSGVVGIEADFGWNEVAIGDGQYRWDALDRLASDAAKCRLNFAMTIKIGLPKVPEWVNALEEISQMTLHSTNERNESCISGDFTGPTPWDPIALQKKQDLINALGARYNGTVPGPYGQVLPAAQQVLMNNAGFCTDDWNINTNSGVDPITGEFFDNYQAWVDAGYTHEGMRDAIVALLDSLANAFPDALVQEPIAPTKGRSGAPFNTCPRQLAVDVMAAAFGSSWGTRFNPELNDLQFSPPSCAGHSCIRTANYYAQRGDPDPGCTSGHKEDMWWLLSQSYLGSNAGLVGGRFGGHTMDGSDSSQLCYQHGGYQPCYPDDINGGRLYSDALNDSLAILQTYNGRFLGISKYDASGISQTTGEVDPDADWPAYIHNVVCMTVMLGGAPRNGATCQ